jgi:multisubunit Na+/H+ antiporter MnhF subunit
MSIWMVAAVVLVATLAPLGALAAFSSPEDGLVALQMAALVATVALLVMARALDRQILVDLAVVLGVCSFAGGLAYATLLGREP